MKKTLLSTAILLSVFVLQAQDIQFSFNNPMTTNDGVSDFYEVDVMIQTINASGSFKLGSGQLYFNYNTEAFGEDVVQNNKIEVTFPNAEGYVCGQQIDAAPANIYSWFTLNDNTASRVSWAFSQAFSSSTFASDNIDATPKMLCHIKIEFAVVSEDPMFMFEDGASFDDQFFTACGPDPGGLFDSADCANFAGTQLLNDTFDSSMAVLSVDANAITDVSVYPNPIKNEVNVNIDANCTYTIFDINGKQIRSGDLTIGTNTIDMAFAQNGVYFLKLIASNKTLIEKIVKI